VTERKYNITRKNPEGVPEDEAKCVQSVWVAHRWNYKQCSRKRGHGLNGEYCKQHKKEQD
jgi:hypothetical protein